jgi:hypothetical protein
MHFHMTQNGYGNSGNGKTANEMHQHVSVRIEIIE